MKGSLWSMDHKLVTVLGIMEKVYGSKGRMVLLLFDKSSPKQFVQSILEVFFLELLLRAATLGRCGSSPFEP